MLEINYYGLGCFDLKTGATNIITDPFAKTVGRLPQDPIAELATISHKNYSAVSRIDVTKKVIDWPGEYEISGVLIDGLAIKDGNKEIVVYKYQLEEMVVLNCGALHRGLNEEELEWVGDVDILIVPCGGGEVLDAEMAAKLVKAIDPRMVIPSYFDNGKLKVEKLAPVDKFLKELGNNSERVEKIKVARKNLSEDSTQIVVLGKK